MTTGFCAGVLFTATTPGASPFWQSKGMVVIPAVGWGDERSFDFCFTGIEAGAIVAVSTVGTSGFKSAFLRGFKEMVERLQPEKIICGNL